MLHRRFFTAFISAALLCSTASCGRIKNEEISDSQLENDTDTGTTELVITTPTTDGNLAHLAAEFNRSSKNIHVTVRDYYKTANADENSHADAYTQMKLDIASGNGGDIIYDYADDMTDFIDLGMLADLYPYLDRSPDLSRDDIIPSVLKGCEVEGKLPAIQYQFGFTTYAARTEYVGDNVNWTIDDALEAYRSVPDDMTFFQEQDSSFSDETLVEFDNHEIARFMLGNSVNNFVDLKNASCNFTDGRFSDMLSLCTKNEKARNIGTKGILSEVIFAYGFNCGGLGTYELFHGEPFTYVGYPSDNGNGVLAWIYPFLGICETSPNKDAAWEFVKFTLLKPYQNYIKDSRSVGCPVRQDAFDKAALDFDENNTANFYSYLSYHYNLNPEKAVDPKTVLQELRDYVVNMNYNAYNLYDGTLKRIIEDEYEYALNNERTPEECADIIQSRISIYLSEKN